MSKDDLQTHLANLASKSFVELIQAFPKQPEIDTEHKEHFPESVKQSATSLLYAIAYFAMMLIWLLAFMFLINAWGNGDINGLTFMIGLFLLFFVPGGSILTIMMLMAVFRLNDD